MYSCTLILREAAHTYITTGLALWRGESEKCVRVELLRAAFESNMKEGFGFHLFLYIPLSTVRVHHLYKIHFSCNLQSKKPTAGGVKYLARSSEVDCA